LADTGEKLTGGDIFVGSSKDGSTFALAIYAVEGLILVKIGSREEIKDFATRIIEEGKAETVNFDYVLVSASKIAEEAGYQLEGGSE